ncbi:hypothetical protein D3C76_892980 [compost metagenome]
MGADAGVLELQGGAQAVLEVAAHPGTTGVGTEGFDRHAIGFKRDVAGFWAADAGVQANRTIAFSLHRNAVELHAAAIIHGGTVGLLALGQKMSAVGDQQGAFIARGQGMREGQVGLHGRAVAGGGHGATIEDHGGVLVGDHAHGIVVAGGIDVDVVGGDRCVPGTDPGRVVAFGADTAVADLDVCTSACADAITGSLRGADLAVTEHQGRACAFDQHAG